MSNTKTAEAPGKVLGQTYRSDNWQAYPNKVALGFSLFIIYATWRAFENNYFEIGNLLSPFYSPKLDFAWWKALHLSPALLILPVPALFRATCYYYRKAYYRAFFWTPRACAVTGTANPSYKGETGFLSLQNIHRYAFYLATIVLAILWWDAWQTLFAAGHSFNFSYLQVSLGTLVFFANVILLSGYSFGCHACRHLVGGYRDCFSDTEQAKTSLSIWEQVSKLNEHHEQWAWASLFSVAFADFYVRCVASHTFTDYMLFSLAK